MSLFAGILTSAQTLTAIPTKISIYDTVLLRRRVLCRLAYSRSCLDLESSRPLGRPMARTSRMEEYFQASGIPRSVVLKSIYIFRSTRDVSAIVFVQRLLEIAVSWNFRKMAPPHFFASGHSLSFTD